MDLKIFSQTKKRLSASLPAATILFPKKYNFYDADATPESGPSYWAVSVRRVAFQQVDLAISRQV